MKGALVAVALVLAAASAAAEERVLSVDEYRSELGALRAELSSGRSEAAQARAAALLEARVRIADEIVATDRTVLGPVAKGADAGRDVSRVARIAASLGEADDPHAAARAARGILEKVRVEQALASLPSGGQVAGAPHVPWIERAADALVRALKWTGETLRRLLGWLFGRVRPSAGAVDGGLSVLLACVGALLAVVLAALVVAAVRALRRRPDAIPAGTPADALRTEEDADPLSRDAMAWEQHARELAAAGRRREAVRALFHAALVTGVSFGALEYRKGRTNWEHVASLPASVPWRGRFADLTRHFERAWYGLAEVEPEAFEHFAGETRAVLAAARSSRAA